MAFCRIAPFALYMAFVALEELLSFLTGKGFISLPEHLSLFFYPIKALCVCILLLSFRNRYNELTFRDLREPIHLALSVATGIVVFLLWVRMDWTLPFQTPPQGFDPTVIAKEEWRAVLIASRIAGASLVVPIMEELFWRSFLTRYLISADFSSVPVGTFTIPSFAIVAILFGLEHHFIIAGVMAGVAYALVLYRTKSIAHCILSHAVTNLLLGIFVVRSGAWHFW